MTGERQPFLHAALLDDLGDPLGDVLERHSRREIECENTRFATSFGALRGQPLEASARFDSSPAGF